MEHSVALICSLPGCGEEETLAFKAAMGRNVTWRRAVPGAWRSCQHTTSLEMWLLS